YLSLHKGYVSFNNIEAQACAGNISGIISPEKWLEQVFLVFFRDTNPVIFYRDGTSFGTDFVIEFNKCIFSRVLDSVGYQINDAVFDQIGIQCKLTGGTSVLIYNMLIGFTDELHLFCNFLRKLHQVDDFPVGGNFSCFKPLEREEVV